MFNCVINLVINNGKPPYKHEAIATTQQRLDMLQLLVNKYPRLLCIEDIELQYNQYSPTINTVKMINARHNCADLPYWVIGSDSFNNIKSWDNYQELVQISNFIVIPRDGFTINQNLAQDLYSNNIYYNEINITSEHAQLIILDKYIADDISSTNIRKLIKSNRLSTDLIDNTTHTYINNNKIYKGTI